MNFISKSSYDCYLQSKKLEIFAKGKWTPLEDVKLIVCTQIFGKGNWSSIAKYIPKRSEVQVRE